MSESRLHRRTRPPFPLTSAQVERWQAAHGSSDFDTAELDLRLTWAIHAIYSVVEIGVRLAWKGGTAINKLYLARAGQYRLSVDLDFNALGRREEVVRGERRSQLRERLVQILVALDPDSRVDVEHPTYAKDELRWRYHPVSNPAAEAYVKLEISTVERFAILGLERHPLPFGGASLLVQTPTVEELTATKIRAFYDRRKGRDVYDLYRLFEHHEFTSARLRKLVLYYFYRAGHEFRPREFAVNIEEKLTDPTYASDLRPFIRADDPFDWGTAAEGLRLHLDFLAELDDHDREFLLLARHLLESDSLPRGWSVPAEAELPLRWLFSGYELNEEAWPVTLDDIRVHRR